MSKWVVDIHGDIEGDYEIIKKYEEPKTDVLDKVRAEIADLDDADYDYEGYYKAITDAVKIIDKYNASQTGNDLTCDSCENPCVMYEKGMRGCKSQTGAEGREK